MGAAWPGTAPAREPAGRKQTRPLIVAAALTALLTVCAPIASFAWGLGAAVMIPVGAALAGGIAIVTLQLDRHSRLHLEAEIRARESEAKYRLLADHAADVVYVLDSNFARLYVSPSSMEMFGYGPEELVGTQPLQMIHPEDADRVRDVYRQVFSGLEKAQTIERVRHRNGHYIWVEASFRLIRDPRTGEPMQLCGAVRDITQRMAAEAGRKEAEGNFRLLAENANDVVTRAGPDGTWHYVSPAATRVFGVPAASLVGRRMMDFAHPDDRPAMLRRVQALAAGRVERQRPTFRVVRPDGSLSWLEASTHVVFDPLTDEPDGYVSVLRDVTDRVGPRVGVGVGVGVGAAK